MCYLLFESPICCNKYLTEFYQQHRPTVYAQKRVENGKEHLPKVVYRMSE